MYNINNGVNTEVTFRSAAYHVGSIVLYLPTLTVTPKHILCTITLTDTLYKWSTVVTKLGTCGFTPWTCKETHSDNSIYI